MSDRRRPRSRRGFAMAFVLLLTLFASLMIGASLTRQNAQGRTVGRQLRNYQKHHDMLGARAIVELWMSRRTSSQLADYARTEGVDYRFVIKGVMEVALTIEDGQGLPVASAALAPEDLRDEYQAILDRLPEEHGRLVRSRGAPLISVQAAPYEVLAALFEDDGDAFAQEVVAARQEEPLNNTSFFEIVGDYPSGSDAAIQLRQLVTFSPAVWRLRLTMTDQQNNEQTFGMLAETSQSGVNVIEWLEEADLNRIDEQNRAQSALGEDSTNTQRRSRRDRSRRARTN